MRTSLSASTLARYISNVAGVPFIAVTLLATVSGCTQAAGLGDHEPYHGFPDSLAAPCSDGLSILLCPEVPDIPQDGHVMNARPSYRASGVEVTDLITNLTWNTTTAEVNNFVEAEDHCKVLPGDYRLPTRLELVSLLDFTPESAVRIDKQTFKTVQADIYFTKTQYWDDPAQFWGVDFCNNCASTTHIVRSMHISNHGGAICVKNDVPAFQAGPFEVAGVESRFLRDARTGLMWLKAPLKDGTTWAGAGKACANIPDGGYGDFRLPNAKELATLVNDAAPSSAKLATFDAFVLRDEFFWSSTPFPKPPPAMPTGAETLKFLALHTGGGSIGEYDGTEGYVRSICVRGPD